MKLLVVHLYKAVTLLAIICLPIFLFGQSCAYVWFDYTLDGCTVNFEGHSLGDVNSWFWEFDDGATATTPQIAHHFNEPGCYFVKLSVNDGESYFEQEVCIACQDGGNSTSSGEPFNLSIDGPSSVYISNLSYAYSANVSGGTAPYQYSWSIVQNICGSLDNFSPLVDFNTANCTPGTVVMELCVTDYFEQQSCTTKEIAIIADAGDCAIGVSGALEVGENVDLRILGDILGPDCYDAYPYWTWSYGDGEVEGPMFWITEHTYETEGAKLVQATGCPEPFATSGCITIAKEIYIGQPVPDTEIPFFEIEPAGGITVEMGESSSNTPLNIKVNTLPTNIPGKLIFEEYEVRWHLINHLTQETVEVSPLYGPIQPDELDGGIEYSFIPNASFWGCLDVMLEVRPWGYYNGQIDVDCDNDLSNDPNCGGGNPCWGIIGETDPIDLSIGHPAAEWGGASSGCAYEEQHGYEFPFIVVEQCKVEVIPQAPEITDIILNGDCNPYLSAETILGAADMNAVPGTAPCGGQQPFPEYRWKAMSILNPNQEIEDFFLDNNGLSSCIAIDQTHDYFDLFNPGEQVIFIVRLEVEDHFGQKAFFTKPIGLIEPLVIHLPSEITRCPGTISALSNEPIISGGVGPFDFNWGGLNVTGVYPNFEIDVTDLPNTATYQIKITDLGSQEQCEIIYNLVVNVSPLTITNVPTQLYACSLGEGENTLSADVYGGSGRYSYEWSPYNHLLDPFALETALDFVFPVPDGETPTEIYTLTVTDEYGCSQTSPPVTVEGIKEVMPVDAGDDLTICYGAERTIGFYPPIGSQEGYYYWTSDYPDFAGAQGSILNLSGTLTRHPGTYTYTLHGVAQPSGCVFTDDVQVTITDRWAYTGYESGLSTLVVTPGQTPDPVALWLPGINDFLANPNPSGHQPPLTYIWMPSNGATANITAFNDNVPSAGTFVPTEEDPFLELRVFDDQGCYRDLKTNRYLLLEAEPSLHIASNQGFAACYGEEVCFDITFDARYSGDGSTWLPPYVTVDCDFNTFNSDQVINLEMINGQGLYRGSLCISNFSGPFQPGIFHVLTVTTLAGTELFGNFTEDYYFQMNGESTVQAEDIVCGFLAMVQNGTSNINYISEAYDISVAVDDGACVTTNIATYSQLAFRAGNSITFFPEHGFNNENGGQLLAFIDPCLVSEFKEEEEEEVSANRSENSQNRIDYNISQTEFSIYPNPFQESVTLNYTLENEARGAEVSIRILGVTGGLLDVIQAKQIQGKGNYQVEYNTAQLPPGIYFYELSVNNMSTIKKGIKAQF